MNHKKIAFLISLFLIFFIICTSYVLAKYEIIETRVIAQLAIDRTAPIGTVTYSKEKPTKENVVVTITVNEPIQPLDEWEQVEKNIWEKEYKENTKEEILLKDLSGNETKLPIIIQNIDRQAPKIEVKKCSNSNVDYPNYANKEATISILLEVKDDNQIQDFLEETEIVVMIREAKIQAKKIQIKQIENKQTVEIILEKIKEEGQLQIRIPKNSIIDEVGNANELYMWDSGIWIDNTIPEVKIEQNKIEEGKVQVKMQVNEKIRTLEGWKESENTCTKIFENNISYEIPIQDLAGNIAKAKIEIKDATSIVLRYASHNSEVGWTFGYGNYDIAGLEAIQKKRKLRTEALAFSIEGNVDPDFLQVRAYVHTYWGEGKEAICQDTNKKYKHGFNPSSSTWKSMNTKEGLVKLGDKKQYFILGGAGVNLRGQTDNKGEDPIPDVVAVQHLYGISGISFKLKDTSYYSIVYQIYIEEVGWLSPCKNEEFTCYQKDKPISGIRIALVPNSELNYLWDTWEKETGDKIE